MSSIDSKLQSLKFLPGFHRESTQYAEEGKWFGGNRVRFREGKPENIRGYSKHNSTVLSGQIRDVLTWSDNNTKKMIINKFNDKTDIDEKLFKDLGDSYNFEHSMRNWYSTPNTQIPNDQKGFADFCYGDMSSCKEGDALACSKTMPPRIINM